MMLIFFAVIGASAGDLQQLTTCWCMIGFLTIMVAVHWLVLVSIGGALGLSRKALILGSNANIGGPATAASESLKHTASQGYRFGCHSCCCKSLL